MGFLKYLALFLATSVSAQNFGIFLPQSQLTSYDNTLLDATDFVLTPGKTDSLSQIAPSLWVSNEGSRALSASSSLQPTVPTPSITASAHIPLLTSGITNNIVSSLTRPAYMSSTLTRESNAPAQAATSVSSTPSSIPEVIEGKETDCFEDSHPSWLTFLSTNTITSTSTSIVQLSLTRRIYLNDSRGITPSSVDATSQKDEAMMQTSSHTSCELSLTAHASSASFPPLASLSLLALPKSSKSLGESSPTSYPTCTDRTVTETLYELPSVPTFFLTQFNGTEVLVLNLPHSTSVSPAWPFYENPQWNALSTIPPATQLPPKRQQVPSSKAVPTDDSLFTWRGVSYEFPTFGATSEISIHTIPLPTATSTTHMCETLLVITATYVSTVTYQPSVTTGAVSESFGVGTVLPLDTTSNPLTISELSSTSGSVSNLNGFISSLLQTIFGDGTTSVTAPAISTRATEIVSTIPTAIMTPVVPVTGISTAIATATGTLASTETTPSTSTATATASSVTIVSTVSIDAPATSQSGALTTILETASMSIQTATDTWTKASSQKPKASSFNAHSSSNMNAFTYVLTASSYFPVSESLVFLNPSITSEMSVSMSLVTDSSGIETYATSGSQGLVSSSGTSVLSTISQYGNRSKHTDVTALSTKSSSTTTAAAPKKPEVTNTVTTGISAGTSFSHITSVSTASVSTATSSGAIYDCVSWSGGNDVLVCHINGQTRITPPTYKSILFGAVCLATVSYLF